MVVLYFQFGGLGGKNKQGDTFPPISIDYPNVRNTSSVLLKDGLLNVILVASLFVFIQTIRSAIVEGPLPGPVLPGIWDLFLKK